MITASIKTMHRLLIKILEQLNSYDWPKLHCNLQVLEEGLKLDFLTFPDITEWPVTLDLIAQQIYMIYDP